MTSSRTVPADSLAAACPVLREGEAADAIDGMVPAFVASPGSTLEAAALLRAAASHDLAVVPRGSGSRLGWGATVTRCDLVVDMLRMDAVTEHAAGDLVARVLAGARMNHVLGVLAAAGQEIALDVPGAATVGGVVASGLCGPRRLRYGSPRDLLIGITVVRADGTVAKSGGKVVKNVAGYDLGKLFAGSAGTLGLITEATFRLHPVACFAGFRERHVPGRSVIGVGRVRGGPGGELAACRVRGGTSPARSRRTGQRGCARRGVRRRRCGARRADG